MPPFSSLSHAAHVAPETTPALSSEATAFAAHMDNILAATAPLPPDYSPPQRLNSWADILEEGPPTYLDAMGPPPEYQGKSKLKSRKTLARVLLAISLAALGGMGAFVGVTLTDKKDERNKA
jgi:hypothetical protein